MPRYWWRQNLRSAQKIFSQTCLNYILLGCSLCTDKFLIKRYGFKIRGKKISRQIKKCYDVITDRQEKKNFLHIIILYIVRKVVYCWSFLLKDHDLKIMQKGNISHFLYLSDAKKSEARNHYFEVLWGQLKRSQFLFI